MKTAVIYARYSSDSQTEQSIEGQLSVCEDYAKSHNMIILNTYIDRAMTGTNDNRAAFQQMIKESSNRQWNYIIVYKLDRFSRDKYATAVHKKTLSDNGVKLLSATEHIPDTPEGIIFESMLEGYAAYYSAELSQKVRRGMKETRKKGNFTGGFLLYGYKVENKKVVIDEAQAEIVRYIYEQYSMGVYVRNIIKELALRGIYNRGKPFARNTIYNILKNEKYSGVYNHNGDVFDNIYPKIVPTDIYEKVRNKIDLNKYGKRSVEVVYLLRNKVICGYCGKPISAECGTSKKGKTIRYYKCLGRKNRNGCKKEVVRKNLFEDFILENIIQEFNKPKIIETIVSKLMALQDDKSKTSTTLNILFREKKQTLTSIQNIMSAIEKGVVTDTTTKRLKELEIKAVDIERKLIIERSKNTLKLTVDEIRHFYISALKLEPQLLINILIKEITLYDDKVIIKFNKPTTSPDENQGFYFYSKTACLPYVIQNKPTLALKEIQLVMSI